MTTSTIQAQFDFILSNLHLYTSSTTWADKLSALGTVKGFQGKKMDKTTNKKVKTTKLRKVTKAKTQNKVKPKVARATTVLFKSTTVMPLSGYQKTTLATAKKATQLAQGSLAKLAKKLDKSVKEVSEMSLQNLLQVQEGGYNASLRNAATEVIETIRVAVEATKVARLA